MTTPSCRHRVSQRLENPLKVTQLIGGGTERPAQACVSEKCSLSPAGGAAKGIPSSHRGEGGSQEAQGEIKGVFMLHVPAHSSGCSQVWGAQEALRVSCLSRGSLKMAFPRGKRVTVELAKRGDASL